MKKPFTVLVAGAGPVGLTLAYELTRRGVPVRLVDAAPGPAVTSRAIATHPRTLETYDQMGLAEAVLARGQRVEGFTMFNNGHRLVRLEADYHANPTVFPYTLSIDQVGTEAVLREALSGLGVEVEWGTRLTDLAETGGRVEVVLERAAGGGGDEIAAEHTAAAWVVGCDGGHSTVRRLLDLPLTGDSNETWLLADATVRVDVPRNSIYWIRSGTGTLMLVPLPGEDRWRMLDTSDTTGAEDPDGIARRFAAKLGRGLGRTVEVDRPTWISVFTAQQRMVPSMRRGRVLVAGDAAHVHSPASGQGMNTGIQEAFNLGWKLAMVVDGHADPALLDSYGAERVPIGRDLLRSTRQATSLVALRNAMAGIGLPVFFSIVRTVRPLRAKIQNGILGQMSGLAIGYADSPLTCPAGPGAPGAGPRPGERITRGYPVHAVEPPGWRALREQLRDLRWTLLVAEPIQGSAEIDQQAARRGAVGIARRYAAVVSVRTLTDFDSEPGSADIADIADIADAANAVAPLADPDGSLRRSLGVGPGDWLLVRPDGYLAARGSALTGARIEAALARAHVAPVPAAAAAAEPARTEPARAPLSG